MELVWDAVEISAESRLDSATKIPAAAGSQATQARSVASGTACRGWETARVLIVPRQWQLRFEKIQKLLELVRLFQRLHLENRVDSRNAVLDARCSRCASRRHRQRRTDSADSESESWQFHLEELLWARTCRFGCFGFVLQTRAIDTLSRLLFIFIMTRTRALYRQKRAMYRLRSTGSESGKTSQKSIYATISESQ